jgi:DNA replication protein DnaC
MTEAVLTGQQDLVRMLRKMKLEGFADELEAQCKNPEIFAGKTFEFRLSKCLESQVEHARLAHIDSLLRHSGLRERRRLGELDLIPSGLSQDLVASLGSSGWISNATNIVIVGPTGVGKTALACALGMTALKLEVSVKYFRTSDLLAQLEACDYRGRERRLRTLGTAGVLILDDFCVNCLPQGSTDLLYSIMERRTEKVPTIIASQLKVGSFRDMLGATPSAEGTLDRILRPSIKIEMHGESKRGKNTPAV